MNKIQLDQLTTDPSLLQQLLGNLSLLLEHYSVSISDEFGVIHYANPKFFDMNGFSPIDIIGQSYKPVDPRIQHWDELKQRLAENRAWRGEIQSQHHNGSYFWADAMIIPLSLLGNAQGYMSVSTDITRLKSTLEALADEVNQKQSQLDHLQSAFKASRKMLSLGTMASNIAHEINNPLSFVASGIQLLNKRFEKTNEIISLAVQNDGLSTEELKHKISEARLGAFFAELPEILAEMENGIFRVLQITTDLKTYCLGDDDKSAVFDINECIRKAVRLSSGQLNNHTRFELMLDNVPLVRGNEGRVCQALLNIFTNSIQALIGKGGVIWISTANSIENDLLFITIGDTGCGISPDNISKIFDPFFTTRTTGKGVGLGLTVCADIIEAHGGNIRCTSQEGIGTEFVIQIPVINLLHHPSKPTPEITSGLPERYDI